MPTAAKPKSPAVCRLVLVIAGVAYTVKPVSREALADGVTVAWRLIRADKKRGKVAHVVANGLDGLTCDCEAFKFSGGMRSCKHTRSAAVVGLI